METQLIYHSCPSQYSCSTQVIFSGEDEEGKYIIPMETIFYFGGGGQPADIGNLVTEEGASFPIMKVVPEENAFKHYFQGPSGCFKPGEPIQITISPQVRDLHSRIHTAGHLVSSVITEALHIPLVPLKGYHYPDSPYVECGNPKGLTDIDLKGAQASLTAYILKDLPVTAFLQQGDQVPLHTFKPPGFQLTPGKTMRWVGIESFLFYPCAGTHAGSTGALKEVKIKYIKSKKGNVRIAYQVSP